MAGVASVALRAAGRPKASPALTSRWELDETSSAAGVFEDRGPAHVLMILSGTWADLTTGSLVEGIGGTSAYTDGSAYATIPANMAAHDLAALTISFYYQRGSAAAKHTLLAAGDGTQAGDFAIELLESGRLRGWHVGQDGVRRFFESTDGVSGTDLQVDTAYRIEVTFGPQGARIYLDGAALTAAAIPAHTNGWNNARIKYLGRSTDGASAPAVGAFDRLRLWSWQLSDAEIALLEPPQSTTLPDLSAVPSAPAAGAYWVDPIDGSDSASAAQARSATSFPSASPWKTLARAIAQWNAGNLSAAASGNVEIILRGGLSYERGNNLTITRSGTSGSHLVIKGYRNDIAAGTRGGTGKYTGAKGRFVLRGNIQALESGGWEAHPSATGGRLIYRTTSTFSITGKARANWLGSATHNLQLWPARSFNDLNTNTITGTGSAIYCCPSIVEDSNRFAVRLEENTWTETLKEFSFGVPPTWGTNPSSEPLAVYDDTVGLRFDGTIRFVDLIHFNIEYWDRPIRGSGGSVIENLTLDWVHIKASFYGIHFRDISVLRDSSITHCDLIQNIPPWGERNWIHSQPIQAQWDGIMLHLNAQTVDGLEIGHNRFVRCFDGVTFAGGGTDVDGVHSHHNHCLQCRDDTMSLHTGCSNMRYLYNYFQECFAGIGRYEVGDSQSPRNSVWIGYNIIHLTYSFVNGHGNIATAFDKGTASTEGGMRAGRIDSQHGNGQGYHEAKYLHNTFIYSKDANSNGGASDGLTWNSNTKDTANPSEAYNNIFVQMEDCSFLGGVCSDTLEMDYNIKWFDPAGDTFGGGSQRMRVRNAADAQVSYNSWAAFVASGTHYNQTKHSQGEGPGSPQGWDANSAVAFGDPDFVNGKWESIVLGNLATYFPNASGNLEFAVNLTSTGWPEAGNDAYVGAYQPGDPITKIGPEQGLWVD